MFFHDPLLHLQHAHSDFELLRVQQARMQEGHKGFPVFKERVLGVRSYYQDRAGRNKERRRDILDDSLRTT